MPARRARIYDALALLVVLVVIVLDQWTKALVVEHFSPDGSKSVPLIGKYLVIYYIQNNGAAFGLFANTIFLSVLILLAIAVVSYLYIRMLNSGPVLYKLIFGLIIGGALGNLIDRIRHSGQVVDFISFRIPEIHYFFAIFNVADACISVGVSLLFVLLIFGGLPRKSTGQENNSGENTTSKEVS